MTSKKFPSHCEHCGKPFQRKGSLNFCNTHVAYLVNPEDRDGKPVKKHWCSECSKKNTVQLPRMRGAVVTTTIIKNDKDEEIYELRVIPHQVEDIPGYDFYRLDIVATHLPTGEWASFIRNLDIEDVIDYKWNIRKCIHASRIRGIICDILYWATSDPQQCFTLLEEDRTKRKWKDHFVSKEPFIHQLCIEAQKSEYEDATLFRTHLFRSEEECLGYVIANCLPEIAEIVSQKYPGILEKPWHKYKHTAPEIRKLCKRVKEWLKGEEGKLFLEGNEMHDDWDLISWEMKSHILVE